VPADSSRSFFLALLGHFRCPAEALYDLCERFEYAVDPIRATAAQHVIDFGIEAALGALAHAAGERDHVLNQSQLRKDPLEEAGDVVLADRVNRFVEQMPPPATDQMQLVRQFGSRGRPTRVDPMEQTR
jgi:hypothetical protein